MKKLFFGMACVIGLMFMASCTPEQINNLLAQKPTVEFVEGDGLISNNTGVYFGEPLNFMVMAAPNSGSGAELSTFKFALVDMEGNSAYYDTPAIDYPTEENYFAYSITPEIASTYLAIATITDANKKSAVDTVVVNYVKPVVEGIGTFEGPLNINGSYSTNEVLNNSYQGEYNFENVNISLILGTVDEENGVSATLDIDGVPVTLYGTNNEGVVTFAPYNINMSMPIEVNGIDLGLATVVLDLTINMTGTLVDDVLTLNGTGNGTGSATVGLGLVLSANYSGTIEGSLTKVVK